MTDFQLLICAAVVAFSVSAMFGVGVIFSVCNMLKDIEEETPEERRPTVRYEYTTRYVNNNADSGYRALERTLRDMGENGWRVLEMQNTNDQFYYIYFERPKIKDDAKTQNF